MDDTGYHYLIDAHVRHPSLLLDATSLKNIFAAALAGFSVLNFVDHKFANGGGVTGLFLLAESHCSYHTYPESAYIAIDVFTCGRQPSEIVCQSDWDAIGETAEVSLRLTGRMLDEVHAEYQKLVGGLSSRYSSVRDSLFPIR